MHENEVSEQVIGAAIEVHRALGPGLLESVYEEALCHELPLRQIGFERQKPVPIRYKRVSLATDLRLDLIVERKLVVDVKAKERMTNIRHVKTSTYLRLQRARNENINGLLRQYLPNQLTLAARRSKLLLTYAWANNVKICRALL